MTDILWSVIQFALGIVFLGAGIFKLLSPASFGRTAVAYDILPASIAFWSAVFIIIPAELFVGFSYLLGWWIVGVSIINLSLLSLFLVAVWLNLVRGRTPQCGCFGGDDEVVSTRTAIRIAILLGATALVLGKHSVDSPTRVLSVVSISLHDLATVWLPFVSVSLVLVRWTLLAPEILKILGVSRKSAFPIAKDH